MRVYVGIRQSALDYVTRIFLIRQGIWVGDVEYLYLDNERRRGGSSIALVEWDQLPQHLRVRLAHGVRRRAVRIIDISGRLAPSKNCVSLPMPFEWDRLIYHLKEERTLQTG